VRVRGGESVDVVKKSEPVHEKVLEYAAPSREYYSEEPRMAILLDHYE